jgi:hypothetical protein
VLLPARVARGPSRAVEPEASRLARPVGRGPPTVAEPPARRERAPDPPIGRGRGRARTERSQMVRSPARPGAGSRPTADRGLGHVPVLGPAVRVRRQEVRTGVRGDPPARAPHRGIRTVGHGERPAPPRALDPSTISRPDGTRRARLAGPSKVAGRPDPTTARARTAPTVQASGPVAGGMAAHPAHQADLRARSAPEIV